MDDARREELQALKHQIFFDFLNECDPHITKMQSMIRDIRDCAATNNLSEQVSAEFCEETESTMIRLYVLMEHDFKRIHQIIAQLNDDDIDQGNDDSSRSSPSKK